MSKRRKPKKARNGKRAHLRKFASDVISMGSAKHRDGSTTVAKEAAGFYNAARSLRNPWMDMIFPGARNTSPERQAALSKRKEIIVFQERWQSDFQTGINTVHSVCYVTSRERIIRLYFSGTRFMFIEHDYQLQTIRRSCIYRTGEQARHRFMTGMIIWYPSVPMPQEDST